MIKRNIIILAVVSITIVVAFSIILRDTFIQSEDDIVCTETSENFVALVNITENTYIERIDIYTISQEHYVYSYDKTFYTYESIGNYTNTLCMNLVSTNVQYDKDTGVEWVLHATGREVLDEGVHLVLLKRLSDTDDYQIIQSLNLDDYDHSKDYDEQTSELEAIINQAIIEFVVYETPIID